jgi:hypothetical protein
MRFKEALSKKALLEFGNLGKLINQGFIVMPDLPDRGTYGLDDDADGLNKLNYLEDMKQYRREIADYKRDKPKLCALIMKYLSDESIEAVQKEAGWTAVETDTDLETLWQLVALKHKVHSSSEVEAVMKLAARTQLASTWQGAYESIISFKQRYNNSLKACNDQKNPAMKPEDVAMDFFSKLDNGRYAEFKTTIINGLQMKSIKPPKDLNEIFTLANTYLKPKLVTGPGGAGSTIATTADTIERKPGDGKGKRNQGKQHQGPGKDEKNSDGSEQTDGSGKKKIKCFSCGGDHCINNCPEFLKFKKIKEEEKRVSFILYPQVAIL